MKFPTHLIGCAAIALSACGSSGGSDDVVINDPLPPQRPTNPTVPEVITKSEFAPAHNSPEGNILEFFGTVEVAGRTGGTTFGLPPDQSYGGYQFAVGRVDKDDFKGFAAFADYSNLQNANPVVTPAVGVVTYPSTYRVVEITDFAAVEPGQFIVDAERTGAIDIIANFNTNAVTGTSDLLTIAGTLGAGEAEFTGTATWRGIEGEVKGYAGQEGLASVFQGHTADTVFAGATTGRPAP